MKFSERHQKSRQPKAQKIAKQGTRIKLFAFLFCVSAALLLVTFAGRADQPGLVKFLENILVPDFMVVGPPAHAASFDISWVDNGTYYFADRGPTAAVGGHVDVFDAKDDTFLFKIGGFVGNRGTDISGPNGILVVHKAKELWAGDGDSTVKVVDLDAQAIVDSIPTGGKMRADELAYDPIHDIIVIANDADSPPFLTFIDRRTHDVLGHIKYDGSDSNHPLATDGLEQPVFDNSTQLFYQAVPATTDNIGGEIDAIDPTAMTIVHRFAVEDCIPHGLTLTHNHQLLLGCSDLAGVNTGNPGSLIMDDRDGKILAKITEVTGSDEVWFNPGDNRYYLAASNCGALCGGPVLGVIDALSKKWLQNVPTGTGAHSVAANQENNHVFVPISAVGGVSVFSHEEGQSKVTRR
jgi:DNA-binding beta-propeller fold protein YncE